MNLEMSGHRIEPTILREYDIRGVIGETLSNEDARAIGRAFGTAVVEKGGKSVCVGYDGRLSSPELEEAVVEGLVQCGLKAVRIGLGPTPMLYFAVNVVPADAGIMISGSHNPPEYNGFKMMMGKAPFYGDDILRLGQTAVRRLCQWHRIGGGLAGARCLCRPACPGLYGHASAACRLGCRQRVRG